MSEQIPFAPPPKVPPDIPPKTVPRLKTVPSGTERESVTKRVKNATLLP